MAYEAEREAAAEAAQQAAKIIRGRVGDLTSSEVSEKGRNDLVTSVDLESQETIYRVLSDAFSAYGFLGEEDAADRRKDPEADQWIIDPLDGTTNFVHGLPPFSVSIALQYRGAVVLGTVLEVGRDELFEATAGAGATMNGRPIRVSAVSDSAGAMLATGFPTRDYTTPYLREYLDVLGETMRGWQSVRRMGSAAADLAYVACGRFDGFFEIGLSPWDSAAGSLLIQEAGGRVTDFIGRTDFLYRPQVLATNGLLHEALINAVDRLKEIGITPFGGR